MYTDSDSPKRFIWDETKAKKNLRNHGISFDVAKDIFFDPYAIEAYDINHSGTEDRFKVIGMVNGKILVLVYVEREAEIRIISARPAGRAERTHYEENETERNQRS